MKKTYEKPELIIEILEIEDIMSSGPDDPASGACGLG